MDTLETIYEQTKLATESKDSAVIVQCCRDGLRDVTRLIFDFAKVKYPESASLLEILDSPPIAAFVGDSEIIDSLHYIRILGINAKHGKHIKKTEARLAKDNFVFFLGFVRNKTAPKEQQSPEYIKLPYMSEAATRRLYIDLYLREAGWDVLTTEDIAVPAKAGIEIKVAGMPNAEGIGFCDYVLYGKDGKPLAIVEAKKTSVSPEKGRHQVALYGQCMAETFGYTPVLYYTNGYSIRCIDGLYPDRELIAFHTLSELELLIQRRTRKNISDLRLKENITNRPYQKMAITNLCEHLNARFRRGLLVMATGTGKTRVSISLVDVLARNQWIKNILFLADRTSLVSQAHKNFVKLLPDFNFCILSDHSDKDMSARIMFSTYQTMINYVDGEEKKFSTGRFDLIIIDEAHRSIFNKYKSIFTYFDSLLVGLTATPKSEVDANTYRIFDCESGTPNFDYSLQEAVKEHFLVPYRVVNRTTKLMKRGIKYADLSPEEKKQVEEAFADAPPEMGYDVSENKLFKEVFNETTCDRVLQDVMERGLKIESGDKIGKTIIFAYNHCHAKMIVERFHKLYPSYGADYCQLIDNYVKYADDLIRKFEEQPDFQIAVSVDMLDTGIDVPAVLNLVFFKPVKSKIKFVQMIGRGTRLCPNVFGPGKDKENFLIFDYCGNFEFFGEHPDTIDPTVSLSITQRLFNFRLAILLELQKVEHQEIEFNKNYHSRLLEQLHQEIVTIRTHANRIQVREAMPYVDKYHNREIWSNLSPVNQKEIEIHLTPLLDSDSVESELIKAFDARMLHIEISLLATGNTTKARRDVEVVRKACQFLLNKASIPQILEKSAQLKTLVSEQFWLAPTVEKLETMREELRELMRFLETGTHPPVVLHIDDATEPGGDLGGELIDIRTYRQKVMDYLAEHSNSPVIQKIRNLEKINAVDLKALENILWHQLGTKEEYVEETKTQNLAVFVRSLIGLNQEAVNRKFGDFLNGNVLTPQQQEFVKAIINYVRENGNITPEDLLEKTPFVEYDVSSLFGDKLPVVLQIISTMQSSVTVAA